MKIAVVILNWNGKSFLEKFLPQVIKYSSPADIIVADNRSTDNSVQFLKANFPSVRIIELSENSGFAGGYNKALKRLIQPSVKKSSSVNPPHELTGQEYDYYILLNSDVEVTEDWIQPVILSMEKNKNIAAAQPKIKSFAEKEKFEYAGAAGGYIDKFGYPFCRGRIFETIEADHGQYNNETHVFWASGACMFIRSEAFHELGGFDEDYFAHMEEIDLCWRLKNAGYEIMYCPDSTVYHMGGGTLPKSNPKKTYFNFRNSLYTLLKNLPSGKILPVFCIRLILDGVAGIKFLVQGNAQDCFAIIKAHFSVYANFRYMLKKRAQISVNDPNGVYKRSIVWNYYIRGKKTFEQLQGLETNKKESGQFQ